MTIEEDGRGREAIYVAAWLPYLAAWVVVFLSSGVASPGLAVRGALANVLPDALLGRLVLAVPRLVPWPEEGRRRFVGRHLTLGLAFSVVATLGKVALLTLERAWRDGKLSAPRVDLRILPWLVFLSLLVYLTLAAVTYALANAERVRSERERAARAEALRVRAELAALRQQLNPHFLLNTLHSALGLVARDPAGAEGALERLGALLHYGLRVHRAKIDQVGLREEWDFVAGYLELEKLRLGDRLRVTLAADEDALASVVPPFSLQPLVENAVRHAVAPHADGGAIVVRARRRGTELHLEVQDDGPGWGKEAFEESGLGLRLVGERLAALYGDQARLSTATPTEGGFHVTVVLPAEGAETEPP